MNLWWQARSNRDGHLLRGVRALVVALLVVAVVVVTMSGSLRWRRGATAAPTPPPPPGATYGPTDGMDSVRLGAGARAVTGGGISFNSSGSLQSAINANPVGTSFVCTSNLPTWNSAVDTGTKAPIISFPGPVGQKIINGGGAAFIPIQLGINSTLQGGTWQNFGVADTIHGIRMYGDNATVEDVVVTGMWNSGIAIPGNGATVSHSTFHTNGQNGYSGAGDDVEFAFCEIADNNTRNVNPGFEGGAGKWSNAATNHFHHNYSHGNNGYGVWWDTGCGGSLIEENVSENNARAGIFYEANDRGVLRRNYSANNGNNVIIGGTGGTFENNVQMRISDDNCVSGRGDISFNIFDYTLAQSSTLGGLLLLWDHTGSVARSCQNWDVHDNQFWLRGSSFTRVGGQDTATGSLPVWDNNSYFGNQYKVASLSNSYWKWGTGTEGGSLKNWTEWRAFHPGDVDRQLI